MMGSIFNNSEYLILFLTSTDRQAIIRSVCRWHDPWRQHGKFYNKPKLL